MNIEDIKVGDHILYMGNTTREGIVKRKSKYMVKTSDLSLPWAGIRDTGYFETWIKPEWIIEVLE